MPEPDLARPPAQLLDDAETWAAALAERGLIAETAAAALAQRLAESRGERLDLPEDPLLVAMLCGPTAVGKSSLINAIAGAEISAPGLGATTGSPILYIHRRDDPGRLFEYSETLGELGREPTAVVRHDNDALRHKVLVDTPDIDSAVRQHRDMTAALVHAADLVLFVTSPEKYRTATAVRWIAAQRQQRALAFVLNKWDREALGLQHDRRPVLERDFRELLAGEGFSDALVFKVSALRSLGGPEFENDLPALRSWLAAGLDRSAATGLQQRRRRSGWGRLAAAIGGAIPAEIPDDGFAERASIRVRRGCQVVRGMVAAEALSLRATTDRSARPATPGLLGSWTRLAARVAAGTAALRSPFGTSSRPALPSIDGEERSSVAAFDQRASFGATAAGLLAQTMEELVDQAAVARQPLGPVAVRWSSLSRDLAGRLAVLPDEMEAELAQRDLRLSFRRIAGVAALYAIEVLLATVLLVALWRLGSGFVVGDYGAPGLLLDTAALLVVLLLIGQGLGNLFFPPFQPALRRLVTQRADHLIEEASDHAIRILSEQIVARERLAGAGRRLLGSIDVVARPSRIGETPDLPRLFGDDATPKLPMFD